MLLFYPYSFMLAGLGPSAEIVKKIEAFEMRSYRRLLRIPFTDHRTNVSIREEIYSIHKQVQLIVSVRKRKLQFIGHIVRSGCLSLTVLQGCVAGGRGRGRPRMSWLDNIISWTAPARCCTRSIFMALACSYLLCDAPTALGL